MILEDRLKDLKNSLGLIGGGLNIYPASKSERVSAWITLSQWDVSFKINKKWAPEKNAVLKEYISSYDLDPNDVKYLILSDILRHEARHWNLDRGCPCDISYKFKIESAVSKVLENEGFKVSKKDKAGQSIVHRVSNMFSDLVINTSNKFIHPPYIGQIAFFYEELQKGGDDKAFDFFAKMNIESYFEEKDYNLVKNNLRKDIDVSKAVKDIGLTKNLRKNVELLSNKKSWPKLAEKFTKHLVPYIDKNINKFPHTSYVRSFPDSKISPDNATDEYSENGRIPGHINRVEFLDALYEGLAEQIVVRSDSQRSKSYPLMKFGSKPFDIEKHKLSEMDLSRIYIDPDSPFSKPITFSHKPYTYNFVLPIVETKEGSTDTCIIMDDSGSMMGGGNHSVVEWGDDSEYHYALLGFYGLMNYAKKIGIAPLVSWNLIRFSSGTVGSGWLDYTSLDKFKKYALSDVAGGGTKIDMNVIGPALDRSPCNVILMSDGGIFNWGEIGKQFLQVVKPHNLAYLEMGSYSSRIGKDIKSAGHLYKQIKTKFDFSNLVFDFVKKQYDLRKISS